MTEIKHIFVDLDDVLCNLVGTILEVIGLTWDQAMERWPAKEWDMPRALGLSEPEVWGKVRALGSRFWRDLPVMEWTPDLLVLLQRTGASWTILSSPKLGPACAAGKVAWIERFLKCVPGKNQQGYILTERKHLLAGRDRLLIDDSSDNCRAWTWFGGRAITVPRKWNGLSSLRHSAFQFVESSVKQLFPKSE